MKLTPKKLVALAVLVPVIVILHVVFGDRPHTEEPEPHDPKFLVTLYTPSGPTTYTTGHVQFSTGGWITFENEYNGQVVVVRGTTSVEQIQ